MAKGIGEGWIKESPFPLGDLLYFVVVVVCALDFLAVLLKIICIRQGKVTILSRTLNSQQFSAPMSPIELLAIF